MMEKPKAIIFDWDGTLAETRSAVVDSLEHVLKIYHKEPWNITKLKYRDANKSLKENFANFFQEQAQEAYQAYIYHYEMNGYDKIKSVKGSDCFLRLCQNQNIELYIVSNKERKLLLKEISRCFPDIQFKKILANGDALHNKPAPDPIFIALKNSSYPINRQTVFFVGDSKQDIDCALSASVLPVLLNTKNPTNNICITEKSHFSESVLVINGFDDLIKLIFAN